jgi:hypothetical protein
MNKSLLETTVRDNIDPLDKSPVARDHDLLDLAPADVAEDARNTYANSNLRIADNSAGSSLRLIRSRHNELGVSSSFL